VTKEPGLDVLEFKELFEERVVEQVGLPTDR